MSETLTSLIASLLIEIDKNLSKQQKQLDRIEKMLKERKK